MVFQLTAPSGGAGLEMQARLHFAGRPSRVVQAADSAFSQRLIIS
jgi:hypothetical protein